METLSWGIKQPKHEAAIHIHPVLRFKMQGDVLYPLISHMWYEAYLQKAYIYLFSKQRNHSSGQSKPSSATSHIKNLLSNDSAKFHLRARARTHTHTHTHTRARTHTHTHTVKCYTIKSTA